MSSSIGHIAISGGSKSLPIALGAKMRGVKSARFEALLEKNLDDSAGASDPASRIAAMLQAGTPVATIVNRVAGALTAALLGAAGKSGDANARSTLQRALAAALAPPGTSPPQEAEALETRLKTILSALSGTTQIAGQKNEIPGSLLDAVTAKESPAPQKKPAQPEPIGNGVAAFARDLLNAAAANMPGPEAKTQPAPQALPPAQPTQVPQVTPTTQAAQAPAAPPAGIVPVPAQAASGGILARIVARAVDAGTKATGAAPSAQTTSPVSSPSAVFEKLVAVLAERGGAQTGNETPGDSQSQSQSQLQLQQQLQPATSASSQPPVSAAAAAHFSVTPVDAAPAQQQVAPYATLDPESVIEQVVKGIVIQTASSTSQIRLRLAPEHLGDVALRLTVNGNNVSASVVAQNANVRDVLLAGAGQLSKSLADAGLSLGSFSVDVSGGNTSFTQQQRAQQQQQQSAFKFGGWQAALSGDQQQPTNDPRYGPSISTSARSLVFNYLV